AGLAVLAGVEGADDVGVVEQGAALGLAVEAVDVVLAADQVVVEDLQRDLAVVPAVVAEVDGAHAALAEPAEDAVVAEAAGLVRIGDGRARGRARGRSWGGPGPGIGPGPSVPGRGEGLRPGRVQVGLFHVCSGPRPASSSPPGSDTRPGTAL